MEPRLGESVEAFEERVQETMAQRLWAVTNLDVQLLQREVCHRLLYPERVAGPTAPALEGRDAATMSKQQLREWAAALRILGQAYMDIGRLRNPQLQ